MWVNKVIKMAKQIDLYKAVNKLQKDVKHLRQYIEAFDSIGLYAYTDDMKQYVIRRLVAQYNRHVTYVTIVNKLRRLFKLKPLASESPIIVKNPLT